MNAYAPLLELEFSAKVSAPIVRTSGPRITIRADWYTKSVSGAFISRISITNVSPQINMAHEFR